MSVLDLRGPEFLLYYLIAMVGAYLTVFVLRHTLGHRPGDRPSAELVSRLTPLEVGYLRDGAAGAVAVAVAALVHRGRLSVVDGHLVIGPAEPERELVADGVYRGISGPRADTPLERAILTTVGREGRGGYGDVVRDCAPDAAPLAERLVQEGLLVRDTFGVNLMLAAIPLALMGVGVAKIAVGLSRDRPVVLLVVLVAATLPALLIRVRPERRSRRGDRALEMLEEANAALRSTASQAPEQLSDHDVALAAGVFGPMVLGGTLAAVAVLAPASILASWTGDRGITGDAGGYSSGSSCSSCGSSCGGGCGGGCGGCG